MSLSSFHDHFRRATVLTPLQYQKRLGLQEARRLMLTAGITAADAASEVGYESSSQFSREYRRLFGAPPHRDAAELRDTIAAPIGFDTNVRFYVISLSGPRGFSPPLDRRNCPHLCD